MEETIEYDKEEEKEPTNAWEELQSREVKIPLIGSQSD